MQAPARQIMKEPYVVISGRALGRLLHIVRHRLRRRWLFSGRWHAGVLVPTVSS